MCSLFQGIAQEGWEYSGQGKGRRKNCQPKHPLISSYNHPPSHHRRRGGKGKRIWKWYWRGAVPKKQRDPLEINCTTSRHKRAIRTEQIATQCFDLLTTDSSSDVDLPQTKHRTLGRVSSMKTSFSMSSLQPPSCCLEGQVHANDRPFYSLRKKPRRVEVDEWRRSWGSRQENKDEFWAALANNYHYLMESNLIDTCKEAGSDLSGGSPTHEWSFQQFTEQFAELNAWLDSIQEALSNRTLREGVEMVSRAYKRKLFNNQSGRLVARSPELKEEVAWRVSFLNCKWERLEQLIHLASPAHSNLEIPTDIEHELRCLRKWIKETEKRLQPLDFKTKWTLEELELKAKEHEVVKKDVWQHSKVVCWLVKQCEALVGCESSQQSLSSWVRGRRLEPTQAASYARGLERRWQLLYLQVLEWQCHIDTLSNSAKQQVSTSTVTVPESDEEPLNKLPRLALFPESLQDEEDDILLMETADIVEIKSEMEVEGNCVEGVVEVTIVSDSSVKVEHCDKVDGITAVEERKRSQDEITSPHEDRKRHQAESNVRMLIGQTLSPGSARRLLLDETTKFNSSGRTAPNCASFYFKHLDTDTEPDCKVGQVKSSGEGESSSEEEWTYSQTQDESLRETGTQAESTQADSIPPDSTRTDIMAADSSLDSIPQEDSVRKKMLAKLLEDAQEMVLEDVVKSPVRNRSSRVYEPLRFIDPQTNTKYTRVKEWLLHHDPDSKLVGDSCDASGECTTEEDESGLDTTLVPVEEGPERERVVLRPRRPLGDRPWSVSGPDSLVPLELLLPHSISESAIHKLSASTPTNVHKINGSGNNMSTLSSSTVEDTSNQTQDGGSGGTYSSNSLRRRKHKLRKRSLMRKSDSGGLETLLAQSDGTLASPLKLPSLAKLSMRRASADKPTSESPIRRHQMTVASPSTSGSDSESESENSIRQQQRASNVQPAFRLGPAHTVCSYASERKDKIVSADSSFSETAWDNYQEKYMSEAYSEDAPDSETARKVLDFGDDYRNFIDSQSDCASSLGPTPLLHRRKRPTQQVGGESDSELEDCWHLVKQSTSQLFFSEKVFNTQIARASPHLVLASDFAELVTTCKDNISILSQMLEKIEEGTALLSAEECKEIRDLISKWEKLERNAEELQKERSLKREMAALRDELLEIATRSTALEADLEDRSQLDLRIQEVKGELSRLRDLNKTQLFQVNLAVHRYVTDSSASPSHLKDQVADLYRLWNDTHIRSCSRLRSLEEAGAAWLQFESHLVGLQVALRGDQEALRLLHVALQEGQAVSPDIASSLRDIAKLLSEKQDNDPNSLTMQETGGEEVVCTTEGSLSDSGISDSGSEQELSERERRLSALRRLVRHLEPVLAPNSQAIANMSKRLEATERELRTLQQTCRELIVKTAVCVEAKGKLPALTSHLPEQNGKSSTSRCVDVGNGKKVPDRWVYRVLKAALPFHIALVALFCIACLLEPNCCDSFNNLDFSLSPQLRFVKGPPPV